jgi:hypothetical protein
VKTSANAPVTYAALPIPASALSDNTEQFVAQLNARGEEGWKVVAMVRSGQIGILILQKAK